MRTDSHHHSHSSRMSSAKLQSHELAAEFQRSEKLQTVLGKLRGQPQDLPPRVRLGSSPPYSDESRHDSHSSSGMREASNSRSKSSQHESRQEVSETSNSTIDDSRRDVRMMRREEILREQIREAVRKQIFQNKQETSHHRSSSIRQYHATPPSSGASKKSLDPPSSKKQHSSSHHASRHQQQHPPPRSSSKHSSHHAATTSGRRAYKNHHSKEIWSSSEGDEPWTNNTSSVEEEETCTEESGSDYETVDSSSLESRNVNSHRSTRMIVREDVGPLAVPPPAASTHQPTPLVKHATNFVAKLVSNFVEVDPPAPHERESFTKMTHSNKTRRQQQQRAAALMVTHSPVLVPVDSIHENPTSETSNVHSRSSGISNTQHSGRTSMYEEANVSNIDIFPKSIGKSLLSAFAAPLQTAKTNGETSTLMSPSTATSSSAMTGQPSTTSTTEGGEGTDDGTTTVGNEDTTTDEASLTYSIGSDEFLPWSVPKQEPDERQQRTDTEETVTTSVAVEAQPAHQNGKVVLKSASPFDFGIETERKSPKDHDSSESDTVDADTSLEQREEDTSLEQREEDTSLEQREDETTLGTEDGTFGSHTLAMEIEKLKQRTEEETHRRSPSKSPIKMSTTSTTTVEPAQQSSIFQLINSVEFQTQLVKRGLKNTNISTPPRQAARSFSPRTWTSQTTETSPIKSSTPKFWPKVMTQTDTSVQASSVGSNHVPNTHLVSETYESVDVVEATINAPVPPITQEPSSVVEESKEPARSSTVAETKQAIMTVVTPRQWPQVVTDMPDSSRGTMRNVLSESCSEELRIVLSLSGESIELIPGGSPHAVQLNSVPKSFQTAIDTPKRAPAAPSQCFEKTLEQRHQDELRSRIADFQLRRAAKLEKVEVTVDPFAEEVEATNVYHVEAEAKKSPVVHRTPKTVESKPPPRRTWGRPFEKSMASVGQFFGKTIDAPSVSERVIPTQAQDIPLQQSAGSPVNANVVQKNTDVTTGSAPPVTSPKQAECVFTESTSQFAAAKAAIEATLTANNKSKGPVFRKSVVPVQQQSQSIFRPKTGAPSQQVPIFQRRPATKTFTSESSESSMQSAILRDNIVLRPQSITDGNPIVFPPSLPEVVAEVRDKRLDACAMPALDHSEEMEGCIKRGNPVLSTASSSATPVPFSKSNTPATSVAVSSAAPSSMSAMKSNPVTSSAATSLATSQTSFRRTTPASSIATSSATPGSLPSFIKRNTPASSIATSIKSPAPAVPSSVRRNTPAPSIATSYATLGSISESNCSGMVSLFGGGLGLEPKMSALDSSVNPHGVDMDNLVSRIDDVVLRLMKSGKIDLEQNKHTNNSLESRNLQKNTSELLNNLAILRKRRDAKSEANRSSTTPPMIPLESAFSDFQGFDSSVAPQKQRSSMPHPPLQELPPGVSAMNYQSSMAERLSSHSIPTMPQKQTVSAPTSKIASIRAKRDKAALRIKNQAQKMANPTSFSSTSQPALLSHELTSSAVDEERKPSSSPVEHHSPTEKSTPRPIYVVDQRATNKEAPTVVPMDPDAAKVSEASRSRRHASAHRESIVAPRKSKDPASSQPNPQSETPTPKKKKRLPPTPELMNRNRDPRRKLVSLAPPPPTTNNSSNRSIPAAVSSSVVSSTQKSLSVASSIEDTTQTTSRTGRSRTLLTTIQQPGSSFNSSHKTPASRSTTYYYHAQEEQEDDWEAYELEKLPRLLRSKTSNSIYSEEPESYSGSSGDWQSEPDSVDLISEDDSVRLERIESMIKNLQGRRRSASSRRTPGLLF